MSVTPIPQSANDIIAITRGELDGLNMWLIVLALLACMFFVMFAIFIWVQYRTPKEAKDIKKASNKGQMAIMVVGLDQYADVMPVNDFTPEGVKETEKIGRGAKKVSLRFGVPKAERVPDDLEVANGKSKEVTAKVLQALYNLNTEKVFLRKAKIPFLAAVRNSVAAVSLKFLGVQTFLEKLERIQKDGALYPQIEALKASKNFKELGLWLEELSTQVSVVDFQEVYARAASTVGQTKLDSISERDQTIGRREGKEDKEKQTKTILVLVFGIIGLIIAGAIVIKVI